jgi:hypothetical protein
MYSSLALRTSLVTILHMNKETPPVTGPEDGDIVEDTTEDRHPYDEERFYGEEHASRPKELPTIPLGLAEENTEPDLTDPLISGTNEMKVTRKLISEDPDLERRYQDYKYVATDHLDFDKNDPDIKKVDRGGMLSGFLRKLTSEDPKAVDKLRIRSIEETAKDSKFVGPSAEQPKPKLD